MNSPCPSAPVLTITGRPNGHRFEVILQGKSVLLSGTSFFYLFQLAFHAVTHPGNWMPKNDIETTNNQARYVYRLRQELSAINDSAELVANNRNGCYRLNLMVSKISCDYESLTLHPDARVRAKAYTLAQQTHRVMCSANHVIRD